jgi:hypothetical protein
MAGTKLFVSEPIAIPFAVSDNHSSTKIIQKNHVAEFWKDVAALKFADKQGCYIFAMRAGKGFTPWYVGRTKSCFLKECFAEHKRGKYNDVLFNGRQGTPVMFFVAPRDGVRVVEKSDLASMEKHLIQIAYAKNSELKNVHGTKATSWIIDGVIRSGKGKPSKKAKQFRTMMGMTS